MITVFTWGLLVAKVLCGLRLTTNHEHDRNKEGKNSATNTQAQAPYSVCTVQAHFQAFLRLIYSTGDISISYRRLKWKIF